MSPYERYVYEIALAELALKGEARLVAGLPRLGGVVWHSAVRPEGRREAPLAAAALLTGLAAAPAAPAAAAAPRGRTGRGGPPALHLWSRGGGPRAWTAMHLWLAAALASRRGPQPPRLSATAEGVAWTTPIDPAESLPGAAGRTPGLDGQGALRVDLRVDIRGRGAQSARAVLAALCLPP